MIIDNVRLAYVNLEQPRAAAEGAEPKYSVTMIIPKKHKQLDEIRAAIKAAAVNKWGDKVPKGLRNPLRDGDAVDENGERLKGEEFTDSFFITASNKRAVEVVAGKDRAKATSDHMRSGNYGCCKVGFFGYDAAGNRGVGCGLNGVWITRRGEPLGGAAEPWAESSSEVEDFSAIVDQATKAGQQDGDIF